MSSASSSQHVPTSIPTTFHSFPSLPAELISLIEDFTNKATIPNLVLSYLSNESLQRQAEDRLVKDILLSEGWLKVYQNHGLLEKEGTAKMNQLGGTVHLCGPIGAGRDSLVRGIYTQEGHDGTSMSSRKAPVWASYPHFFGTSKEERTIPTPILSIFNESHINTHQEFSYGGVLFTATQNKFLSDCRTTLADVPHSVLSVYLTSTPSEPSWTFNSASGPQVHQAFLTATAGIPVKIIVRKHKEDDLTFYQMSKWFTSSVKELRKRGGGRVTLKGMGYTDLGIGEGKTTAAKMHEEVSRQLRIFHQDLRAATVETIMSRVSFDTSGVE